MSKRSNTLFKLFELKSHSNQEKYAEEIYQNDLINLIKVIFLKSFK